MKARSFKQELITSLCCTIVAVSIIACGSKMAQIVTPPATNTFKHLTAAASSGSRLYKASSNLKAMALFQTAPTPSALQQSFLGKCTFTISGGTTGIPAGDIMALVLDRGDENNCQTFFSGAQPQGSIVIDDGTLGTLVVTADSDTTQNLVCKDLTDTAPVSDSHLVSVWFQPSTNKVLVFQDTTATALTCTLPVPAGNNVLRISAQFLKT